MVLETGANRLQQVWRKGMSEQKETDEDIMMCMFMKKEWMLH